MKQRDFMKSTGGNLRRIGFLGISDYGFEYLKKLVDGSKYEVAFVTSKSKKIPHVLELEDILKDYCDSKGLLYLGNVDANDPEFVKRCESVDLCVLGGYDKIVKKPFFSASKFGAINTHFGLIPENRGCNPVMWAILEGRSQGFTTYFVGDDIDYGNIIDKYELSVPAELNSYEAYQLLSRASAGRFLEILRKIESGDLEHIDVSKSKSVYHKQGMPNDSWISWHWNNEFLRRFSNCLIFPPYPCAKTLLEDKSVQVKIIGTKIAKHTHKIGEIIECLDGGKRLIVATKEGSAVCEIIGDVNFKPGDFFTSKVGDNFPIDLRYNGDTLL